LSNSHVHSCLARNSHCRVYRLVLIVGIFYLVASVLEAQQPSFDESWRWVHFTTESGLPSNNVYDVIETPDSTLWAVCDAGIAWYDGFQWQPVQLPAHHLPKSNTPVCDYRNDSLLIGFDEEWYAVGRQGFLKLSIPSQCKLRYFSGDTILCVKDGSPFFMVRGLLQPCEMPGGSVHGRIEVLHRTKGGRVWITTNDGVYRWEDNHWRIMFDFSGLPALQYILSENSAGAVFANFALPLKLRGMWQYSPGSRTAHRVPGDAENIQTIAISPSQILIAASFFGEVRVCTGTSWSSSSILQLECKGLRNLFFRRNGDLVIATTEGIHYFMASSSRWRLIRHSKLETEAVDEILTTRSGDIWIGTAIGIIIHGKNGTSRMITHIGDVPMVTITGLGEDLDGNIWVSSGGSFDGAYRWDGSTWKHFRVSKNRDGERFHKIRKDRRGRLWFLGLPKDFQPPGREEPGVFVYENNQFTQWGKEHDFPDRRVYAFDEDVEGSLWFGTDRGIARWMSGAWQRWTIAQGLRRDRVFTLAIDRHKSVWFGHQLDGFGLGCIDSSGEVKYFTTSDGLVNDFVWEVRVDSDGILWITTRGGLVSYHDGVWSRFDESSGLQSNLLWPVLPLKDEVYVGTHGKGVAILDRRESFTPAPRIVIDKPNVDRQDVHLRWRVYAYWGAIAPSEIITQYRIDDDRWSDWGKVHELDLRNAAPGEHTISVQTRGPIRNSSPEVQRAIFTVLPPLFLRPVVLFPTVVLALGLIAFGFILVIRKRRYNIELREREAKFSAVTQMTHSAIFIFKGDLSIIFSNRSMERLTGYSQEELLTMKVTDILSPEHHSAFLSMNSNQFMDKGAPRNAEFELLKRNGTRRWMDLTWGEVMFQDVQATIGTAFDITERKQAELRIKALASELSATEQRSRRRMAAFLHDKVGHALALSKMKVEALLDMSGQPSIHQSVEEVHALLREVIQTTRSFTFELSPPILYDLGLVPAIDWLVEELQKRHRIAATLRKPMSKIQLADEVRNVLFEGTREVFINAVKHSRAKCIDVSITVQDLMITIAVRDDGVGFDVSSMDQLQTGRKSFGLYNLRERLKDVGGRMEIESAHEKGTNVRLIAPIIK